MYNNRYWIKQCGAYIIKITYDNFHGYVTNYTTALPLWTHRPRISWWRHQLETFSALLAICAGNSPVPGEFPTQRPVTRSFDAYFDLRPNKWLSKQSWGWWFETLSCSLWRHRNVKQKLTNIVNHPQGSCISIEYIMQWYLNKYIERRLMVCVWDSLENGSVTLGKFNELW